MAAHETNANSALLATLLSKVRHGTFTGLIKRKEGETRGRGTNKKVYGNDQVHVLVVTGFDYLTLVKRSLDQLESLTVTSVREAAAQNDIFLDEFETHLAKHEMVVSFQKTLAGTNESTTDHVYEPLTLDGESVKACRVYKCVQDDAQHECKCRDCTGDERAPKTGTIYLQGLQVWSQILEAAPNGPIPAANSSMKTIAKDLFREKLPINRYVSYRLEPGTEFILRAGGVAAVEATERGFTVTEELFTLLTG